MQRMFDDSDDDRRHRRRHRKDSIDDSDGSDDDDRRHRRRHRKDSIDDSDGHNVDARTDEDEAQGHEEDRVVRIVEVFNDPAKTKPPKRSRRRRHHRSQSPPPVRSSSNRHHRSRSPVSVRSSGRGGVAQPMMRIHVPSFQQHVYPPPPPPIHDVPRMAEAWVLYLMEQMWRDFIEDGKFATADDLQAKAQQVHRNYYAVYVNNFQAHESKYLLNQTPTQPGRPPTDWTPRGPKSRRQKQTRRKGASTRRTSRGV